MYRYTSMSVYYRDGKLTSGYLTVRECFEDEKDNVDLHVTLTKPKEIMDTLRKLERVAGHSAKLEEATVYGLFGKATRVCSKHVAMVRFK